MIFQRELIKQRRLCLLLWSHHRQIPRFYREIESAKGLQINKSFSTEFARPVGKTPTPRRSANVQTGLEAVVSRQTHQGPQQAVSYSDIQSVRSDPN
jgi:hypothetical protein